jgi:hypothetical protein
MGRREAMGLDRSVSSSAPFRRRLARTACGVAAAAFLAAVPSSATGRLKLCPAPANTTSEGTPSASLLSILHVLRRPQTSSDALPPPINPGGGLRLGEGVYVKYVRRARRVAGTDYFVVPVARGLAPGCGLREEVVFVTAGPEEQGSGGGSTAAGIEHGEVTGSEWKGHHGVQYGLVPDGVAKVTLRYPPHRGLRNTVTVSPVENVYVAMVPPAATYSGFPVVPKTIVWRSATGKVLGTFHG